MQTYDAIYTIGKRSSNSTKTRRTIFSLYFVLICMRDMCMRICMAGPLYRRISIENCLLVFARARSPSFPCIFLSLFYPSFYLFVFLLTSIHLFFLAVCPRLGRSMCVYARVCYMPGPKQTIKEASKKKKWFDRIHDAKRNREGLKLNINKMNTKCPCLFHFCVNCFVPGFVFPFALYIYVHSIVHVFVCFSCCIITCDVCNRCKRSA